MPENSTVEIQQDATTSESAPIESAVVEDTASEPEKTSEAQVNVVVDSPTTTETQEEITQTSTNQSQDTESDQLPIELSTEASTTYSASEEPAILELETKTATASATSLIKVNTTQIESKIEASEHNLQASDTDVQLSPTESSDDPSVFQLEISNQATASAGAIAVANTGDNTQTATTSATLVAADLTTGDAMAAATTFSVINSTLINSELDFAVINIFHDIFGDIILQNPDYVKNTYLQLATEKQSDQISCDQSPPECYSPVDISIYNQLWLQNSASASAQTGNNTQQLMQSTEPATSTLLTGDAQSVAISKTQANLVYFNIFNYLVNLNILGDWEGSIYGWESPQDVIIPDSSRIELFSTEQNQTLTTDLPVLKSVAQTVDIAQQAEIETFAIAQANTGNNQQYLSSSRDASLSTGNARAVATSYTYANSTFINSQILQTDLNILTNWSGNLIFAYPDLSIKATQLNSQVESQGIVDYLIEVSNIGLATARNVDLIQLMPWADKLTVEQKQLQPTSSHQWLWNLGSLLPGETKSWTVQAEAASLPAELTQLISEWQVKSQDKEILDNNTFQLTTSIAESKLNDEESSSKTEVDSDEKLSGSSFSDQLPAFSIHVQNNVHDFILPGDSVIFETYLLNQGGESHYTQLHTVLLNGQSQLIGGGSIDLDKVYAGEDVNLSFIMALPADSIAGEYQLITWITGESQGGQQYESDQAQTNFVLNGSVIDFFNVENEATQPPAEILTVPKVLGATSEPVRNLIPSFYQNTLIMQLALPFLLLGVIFIRWMRAKIRL